MLRNTIHDRAFREVTRQNVLSSTRTIVFNLAGRAAHKLVVRIIRRISTYSFRYSYFNRSIANISDGVAATEAHREVTSTRSSSLSYPTGVVIVVVDIRLRSTQARYANATHIRLSIHLRVKSSRKTISFSIISTRIFYYTIE